MKRLVLALFALLCLAPSAEAMVRPMFPMINVSSNAAARFYGCDVGLGSAAQAGNTLRTPVSVAGIISDLNVKLQNAPGAGTSFDFTLYKNNAAQAQTCNIADAATTCSDTAHPITFAQGDDCTWLVTPNSTPTVAGISLSTSFTGTASGESWGGGTTAAAVSTGTSYWPLSGATARAVESDASVVAPTNFTLDHLYCQATTAAGLGNSWTYTVVVDGVDTALTCALSGAAQTQNSDLVNSVSVSASSTISMKIVVGGTPTGRFQNWGYRLTPSIDGEYPMMAAAPTSITVSATRFQNLLGTVVNAQIEASTTSPVPVNFTWRKANWTIQPTPGATKTWAIRSRINGVNGNMLGTITNGNTNVTDGVNSDSVTTGQLINWTTAPTNTPAATTKVAFSAVSFIAPTIASTNHSTTLFSGIMTTLFGAGVTALFN